MTSTWQRCQDDPPTALQKVDEWFHLAVRRRVESSDLEVGSFPEWRDRQWPVTAIAKSYNPD